LPWVQGKVAGLQTFFPWNLIFGAVAETCSQGCKKKETSWFWNLSIWACCGHTLLKWPLH
jgi:hypothetical protein